MKKQMKPIFVLSTLLSVASAHASHYLPDQLDQFEKTGECIGCDLSEATLTSRDHANLGHSLLPKAHLSGHFYNSNFSYANLINSGLEFVRLSGSNFIFANLSFTNLVETNLSSCDLTGADLTGADLSYADLIAATVSMEQLAKAKSIKCAIMPDGTQYNPDNKYNC